VLLALIAVIQAVILLKYMKWYFASRTRYREMINKIIKTLESRGETVAFNWTELGQLEPYSANQERCREIAEQVNRAINQTDIFVLISDSEGTDMFVELGIALNQWQLDKKIRIYVVGEYNQRSLMHFHPAIKHFDDIKEVFKLECPNIQI